MSTADYAPLHPSMTPAFEIALRDHREILTELLLGADALQEATFQKLRESGATRCELEMSDWAFALRQGTKAAEVAASMAGYELAHNGRWFSSQKPGKSVRLIVSHDLISTFLYDWADGI